MDVLSVRGERMYFLPKAAESTKERLDLSVGIGRTDKRYSVARDYNAVAVTKEKIFVSEKCNHSVSF